MPFGPNTAVAIRMPGAAGSVVNHGSAVASGSSVTAVVRGAPLLTAFSISHLVCAGVHISA